MCDGCKDPISQTERRGFFVNGDGFHYYCALLFISLGLHIKN